MFLCLKVTINKSSNNWADCYHEKVDPIFLSPPLPYLTPYLRHRQATLPPSTSTYVQRTFSSGCRSPSVTSTGTTLTMTPTQGKENLLKVAKQVFQSKTLTEFIQVDVADLYSFEYDVYSIITMTLHPHPHTHTLLSTHQTYTPSTAHHAPAHTTHLHTTHTPLYADQLNENLLEVQQFMQEFHNGKCHGTACVAAQQQL